MRTEPRLWTIFCDDVRPEAGNKLSYMGVYGSDLIVPAYPAVVPRLCCIFSLCLSATANPRKILFKLFRDDVPVYVADMLATEGRRLLPEQRAESTQDQLVTIRSVMPLADLEVSQRAVLTTRAYVDDEEMQGGQLELLAAQGRGGNTPN